jgi:hypothetical protein
METVFPLLILNARPAAGKSELIEFLRSLPLEERRERFHVGEMFVIDDFPMIWAWFEEDDLLERVFRKPRWHTDSEYYFLDQDYWHLLIRRLCQEAEKWLAERPPEGTCIIEFSRGMEHGGYRAAYQHLSEAVLRSAACFYLQVSWEESRRKNRRRYNPERPHTILQHALEEEKLEVLYREDDWNLLSAGDPEFIQVKGHSVPYVVFDNEADLTTQGGEALGVPLQNALDQLWARWRLLYGEASG